MSDHIPAGLAEYADGARHMPCRGNKYPRPIGIDRDQLLRKNRVFHGIPRFGFDDHARHVQAQHLGQTLEEVAFLGVLVEQVAGTAGENERHPRTGVGKDRQKQQPFDYSTADWSQLRAIAQFF